MASYGCIVAEIAQLHFNLVQEGRGFIERPREIWFILHQHIAVCFLKEVGEKEREIRNWTWMDGKKAREKETMNSSSSGSAPKHVETASLLQRPFSRRISSSRHAISGGAPTWKGVQKKHQKLKRPSTNEPKSDWNFRPRNYRKVRSVNTKHFRGRLPGKYWRNWLENNDNFGRFWKETENANTWCTFLFQENRKKGLDLQS